MKWLVLFLAAAAGFTACAPAVRYHPKPIEPAATAMKLESRSLNDPGLKRFMEKTLGHPLRVWPIEFWTPKDLTLAAYYFNPQMAIARAQAQAAEAAIITAGERPNPTLSFAPGIPSPYLLDFALSFPVVRAGRRGIKIEQAKATSAASEYALAATSWKVRSGVRAAALNYFLAQREVWLAETDEALRSRQVSWLNARLAAGEVAKPAFDSAQAQLLSARMALSAARGRISVAMAALAASIGVPVSTIDGLHYSWTSLDNPPSADRFKAGAIRREAVLNRLDVRQALAQYRAAQAALQLEIARQHPNFSLGPGYQFEEKDNFFTLPFSMVLPVFNRNQGPIAEAEARRKEAAARFLAVQANAIAQSEEALAGYRSAFSELEEARKTLGQMQNVQEPAARAAMRAGEEDGLFYNGVMLQGTGVTAAYNSAVGRAQSALGALEDAVERPLEPGELPPPVLNSERQRKETP
jgi:outer membrane protein, heavy metal efflux system